MNMSCKASLSFPPPGFPREPMLGEIAAAWDGSRYVIGIIDEVYDDGGGVIWMGDMRVRISRGNWRFVSPDEGHATLGTLVGKSFESYQEVFNAAVVHHRNGEVRP